MFSWSERKALVWFMVGRMLRVLEGLSVYVATPDEVFGAFTVVKDEWGDINKVIGKARKVIQDDILVLPCDLPFVEREDIDILLNNETKIVPSQSGGTNALFLPENVDIVTQFGENSFERHCKLFEEKEILYKVYKSDQYRDMDTEADIAWALTNKKDSEFSRFLRELF
jgi:2-phospho-L-lactate guanylyltransferase (CobY/MobA/RfbA family)